MSPISAPALERVDTKTKFLSFPLSYQTHLLSDEPMSKLNQNNLAMVPRKFGDSLCVSGGGGVRWDEVGA